MTTSISVSISSPKKDKNGTLAKKTFGAIGLNVVCIYNFTLGVT